MTTKHTPATLSDEFERRADGSDNSVRESVRAHTYRRCAAMLREAIKPASTDADLRKALEAAWTDFLDANPDDITSPEEWPDHALVTCDQMIGIVEDALAAIKQENSHVG